MSTDVEIIRARFVEAAFTERYLPRPARPHGGGFWPSFIRDEEDYKGYDDQARIDNAITYGGRATSAAITRHQECLDWTASLIRDEKRRHVLWAWAFCRANDWDFGAKCARRGWARPTAYRRLNATIEALSSYFHTESVVVRLPDDKWMRHETPVLACISTTMGRRDGAQPIKFSPGYRTEASRDLIQTPEDADTFAKFLERRNARLRKLQSWRGEEVA